MKIKRNISLILILLLMISSISSVIVSAFDETSENNIIKYVDEDIEPWLPQNYTGEISTYEMLPTSYDPRRENATTPVKDQSPAGSCGIFSTVAAFEHTSYKLTGLKYVYAEESPRMILSYRLGLANNSDNENAFYKNSSNAAWNFKEVASYLSNINQPIIEDNSIEWVSPNLAVDVPYTDEEHDYVGSEKTGDEGVIRPLDDYWPSNINNSYSNSYVTGTTWIPDEAQEIKMAVKNYGAVYTTMLGSSSIIDESYNVNTGAWYTDIKEYSHAVAVVGWDDNYPIENFNSQKQPPGNGAWLVKNSWGNTSGDQGYLWISYYDESFNSAKSGAYVITDVQPVSKNEYTLAYDFASMSSYYNDPISEDSVYPYTCYANVYNLSSCLVDYGSITSIMFYDHNVGCEYDVYIVPLNENATIPSVATLNNPVFTGTVANIGLNNIKFCDPITLDSNYSRYAFVVKIYANENTSEMATYVEGSSSGASIVNPGESYRFVNGTWRDISGGTAKTNYGNVCIRPTLLRRESVTQNSQISTTATYYNGNEITVNLSLNGNLLYSISSDDNTLYEDKDFTRNGNSITIYESFLEELSTTNYTDLVFKFTDGENQTLKIYPKALSDVTVSGKVAQGQTLTANVTCSDGSVSTTGDITYQWQLSSDGNTWTNISGANFYTYTLSANEREKYIRCAVSVNSSSNNILPATKYSTSTATKVVLFGDVNMDGIITSADAKKIQRYLAALEEFCAEQMIASDVNGDGVVSVFDATCISQYVSGDITLFPVEL